MRLDGPAKLLIQIKSDWPLVSSTFAKKSPGSTNNKIRYTAIATLHLLSEVICILIQNAIDLKN